MTAATRTTSYPKKIQRAADWYATNQRVIQDNPGAKVRLMRQLFGLDESEAADAVLLGGTFTVVRRAFG